MNPQLCYSFEAHRLRFPVIVEPKLDGIRAVCVQGEFQSRTGKPMWNVSHIGQQLAELGPLVFDGELIHKDWNNTISVVHTQSQVTSDIIYYIFDMLELEEWQNRLCTRMQVQRSRALLGTIKETSQIKIVSQWVCETYDDILEVYDDYLKQGLEGIVIKSVQGFYVFRRHHAWMKLKPSSTVDCQVTGIQEGTGKYTGIMGALMVDVGGQMCGLGTGFTDDERKSMWESPPIGKMVEVRYQEVTKEGVLRFPSFLRMRPDLDK